MNNRFVEELKHHDINIFRFLMVGNNTLGGAVIVALQRDVGGDSVGNVSIQLESKGDLVDLEKYQKSNSEYHIEVDDAVMDIIISENEVNIGFSYKDESTIQSIKIKE